MVLNTIMHFWFKTLWQNWSARRDGVWVDLKGDGATSARVVD